MRQTLTALFLVATLSVVSAQSFIPDYTAYISHFENRPCNPVEGIWRLTSGGVIAIEATDTVAGCDYVMIAVDSPNRTVMPGTVIGYVNESAVAEKYTSSVFTDYSSQKLSRRRDVVLQLNDEQHLSFIKVGKGVKVNILRLLPYMFRGTITPTDNRPDDLDGAIKIFPPTHSMPITPRYL